MSLVAYCNSSDDDSEQDNDIADEEPASGPSFALPQPKSAEEKVKYQLMNDSREI